MNVDFCNRLKNERKRLHLSQVEIAERCGVSATSYSNYELGKRKPDAEFFQKFSDIGGDTNYLFTGEKSKSKLDSIENILLMAFNRLHKDGHKSSVVTYISMLESGFLKGGFDELKEMSDKNNSSGVTQSVNGDVTNMVAGNQVNK